MIESICKLYLYQLHLCQENVLINCNSFLGNIYYPGYKRNFWLEFSSPSSMSEISVTAPTTPSVPRPQFLHPSTNGSIMTVTLGQTTKIDCMVINLQGYQVIQQILTKSKQQKRKPIRRFLEGGCTQCSHSSCPRVHDKSVLITLSLSRCPGCEGRVQR